MDSLVLYSILFATIYNKDVWGVNLDHNSLKEVGAESRIKGGKQVEIEDYPYAAFLVVTEPFTNLCNGAIISESHIVTVAQCIDGADNIEIRVGSSNRLSGGQKFNADNYMVHPLYTRGLKYYDVGVVLVIFGLSFDGWSVKPIEMVDFGYEPTYEDEVTVLGWGNTGPKPFAVSAIIKEATMEVVASSECDYQGEKLTPTSPFFCAIDKEGMDAACKGDLGGPAIINNVLAGMVSRTTKCKPEEAQAMINIGDYLIRSFIKTFSNK